MADAKRHRPFSAWPNVTLTGPGGENGADLLRELAGDPDTLEAVFACTMGLNAAAILQMMGCRCDVFAVFACHHPERCWQGDPSERRHPKTAPTCGSSSRPSATRRSGARRTSSGTSTRLRVG
jgi:hypothetical protein